MAFCAFVLDKKSEMPYHKRNSVIIINPKV